MSTTTIRPSSSGSHEDRDQIKARAEADFISLYLEAGGRRRGRALHCLFHEDKTPSAAIRKGRFHCFGCGINLDVLGFIEKVQRTDFKGALNYLSDRYVIPLNNRILSDAEKREYARRRAAAQAEGRELVRWRYSMVAALRHARDWRLRAYHRAIHLILSNGNGLDHSMGDTRASIAETIEPEIDDLQKNIDLIRRAAWRDLLQFKRTGSCAR